MSIEAATAASGENENQLTEENLALVDAASATEDRKKSSNEDDKSSVLSKIDSKHSGDLNLSEYCVSSDAETEKMDEEFVSQRNSEHPVLSELADADASGDAGADGATTGETAVGGDSEPLEQNALLEESAMGEPAMSAASEGVAAAAVEPPKEPEKAVLEETLVEQPIDLAGSGPLEELPTTEGPAIASTVSEPIPTKSAPELVTEAAVETTVEPTAEPAVEPTTIEEQAPVPEQTVEEAVPSVESPVVDPLKPSSPVPPSEVSLGPSPVVAPAEVALKQSGPVGPAENTQGLAPGDAASAKRAHEDDEDHDTHFKKPRPPAHELKHAEDNNYDDNDADEDEDEAEEDYQDKAEAAEAPAAAAASASASTPIEPSKSGAGAKKPAPSVKGDSNSPMEQETLRLSALQEITDIEHQFAELRQRLFESKLAKLQTETQMCLEGSHPALQSYYQKIDSVRDYKLRRAYQRQKYELECIDKETKATRCFIHQDFYRKVADLKHELLVSTTQKWYDINKERREMDVVVSDVGYHVPVKIDGKTLSCITGYAAPAQPRREGDPLAEDLQCEGIRFRFKNNPVDKLEVIVDRMRFNNELSDLEGLRQFFKGFPGAPGLSGLKDSEIYEDLQSAGRPGRA
ncbi:LAQU0S01e14114g1_1 [Lachancea quebecensis]|uniref:LAQU0S01e14114g1_1 n=1 Tax=Lachancea quebecensis TaxID=1654605 RepID=A0A0P1KLZ0_9SACH|nr:LAQU0S01e14114g1_1 [Lachancea quebecensis]